MKTTTLSSMRTATGSLCRISLLLGLVGHLWAADPTNRPVSSLTSFTTQPNTNDAIMVDTWLGGSDTARALKRMPFVSFRNSIIRSAYVNALDYGADNTGSVDASAALTAAFAAIASGGRIVIPPGTYKLTNSVTLPQWGNYMTVDIEAEGAAFMVTNAIVAFDRWPSNQTQAAVMVNTKVRWKGGRFIGDNTPGQTAFRFGPTYGAVIESLHAQSFTNGFIAGFCLNLTVRNSHFMYCPLILQAGTNAWNGVSWTSGDVGNSQCNHALVQACRFFGASGQAFTLGVFDSSNPEIVDCVCEGANPATDILWAAGWSGVGGMRIVNMHLEHTPADAFLRLEKLARATVTLDGLSYPAASKLINATNCDSPILNIENVQYLDYTNQFDASTRLAYPGTPSDGRLNWTWNFRNCTGLEGADFRLPKWWTGGVVPRNLTITGAGVEHGVGNLTLGNNPTNPAVRIIEDSIRQTNQSSGTVVITTNAVTSRTNGGAWTQTSPGKIELAGVNRPHVKTIGNNYNTMEENFLHIGYGDPGPLLAFGGKGLIFGLGVVGVGADVVPLFYGVTNNTGAQPTTVPANSLQADYQAGAKRMRLRASDGSAVTVAAGAFHGTNQVISADHVGGAANLTNGNASTFFGSGTVPAARLGSGSTGAGSKTLADDGTWKDLSTLGVTSVNGETGAVTITSNHVYNAVGHGFVNPSTLGTMATKTATDYVTVPGEPAEDQDYDQGATYHLTFWAEDSNLLQQTADITRSEGGTWYFTGIGGNGRYMTNLDASTAFGIGTVPRQNLGSGGDGSGNNVLHDDGTWAPASASSGVTSWNGLTGAVTMTGTHVNTALGYTAANRDYLDAGKLATGVAAPARLGSGTATSSTYLAGDGTWKTLPSSGTYDFNIDRLVAHSAGVPTNVFEITVGPHETVNFEFYGTARAADNSGGYINVRDAWDRNGTGAMARLNDLGTTDPAMKEGALSGNGALVGSYDYNWDTTTNTAFVYCTAASSGTVRHMIKGHIVRNAGP